MFYNTLSTYLSADALTVSATISVDEFGGRTELNALMTWYRSFFVDSQ